MGGSVEICMSTGKCSSIIRSPVERMVAVPICRVIDRPTASMRATAVSEVRLGLRTALEVDSRAVGPNGRMTSPKSLMRLGTYSGAAASTAIDRRIAEPMATGMDARLSTRKVSTDSPTPMRNSSEHTMMRAIDAFLRSSTVGTGRSASNGATRVARMAGRKAARTVMSTPMRNSPTSSPTGQLRPNHRAPVRAAPMRESTMPRTMPSREPSTPSTMASPRTMRRTYPPEAPTARMRPI